MLAFVALAVLASLWFLGGAGMADLSAGTAEPTMAAADQAARVARGSYLARIGNCALCHTARGGTPYAGGRAIETPFGAVVSSNLTPDRVHGLGQWSTQDFWRAMHLGLSKDGHALYPAFPYTSYTRISREDSDALFAYLQTLTPAAVPKTAHPLRWPYNTQLALRVWRALYFQPAREAEVAATPLARGEYLVNGLGHCMECHGTRNALGALSSRGKGGYLLPGSQWYAPSLTDAAQASVAAWSPDSIQHFLQTGSHATAQASGPMAEVVLHGTQYLTDADAQAMATYLQALPHTDAAPSRDKVNGPSPAVASKGAKLYETHCADCHGLQGEGRAGAYPALAGNRAVTMAQTQNLIHAVLGGGFAPATAGNPQPYGMPPFMLLLSDSEVAAVLSHIRSAWGNQAAPVSEFDINQLRRSQVP
jgi:mono/diheme cytochrome c family protein